MELKENVLVFLVFLVFFSFFSFSQVETQRFNQSESSVIIGSASTLNQAVIDSLLNIDSDGLTWNIAKSQVPHRKIKTVEYFIYQDMTQMAANTEKSGSFTVYIPEKNPIIRSAIIEIRNLIYNTQITAGQTVILSNGTTNITLLTTQAGPAATGENMYYTFLINATDALRNFISGSGTYTFTLYVKLNAIRQGENAKLILTYEYDSDSPREIKTIRFFVGQLNSTLAVGSSTNFIIPPLNLPEKNVIIRDAFFETYIHLQPGGNVNQGISIDLDGVNAISGTPINNAGSTTIDYVFLYRNIFDTSTSHTFNFKPTAGYALHAVGTELVLTYEYDSDSELQLKTVRYLIGQDGGLYTTPHTATFSRTIIIPEDVKSIISAYNRITFSIAYGSGAGTTAYTTTIGVNSSVSGESQPRVDYILGLRDEQVSHSMILYNATGLYSITNGTTIVCSVYSSAATTSYYTGSKGCELILTYVYNASNSTSFVNSVEYFVGSSYHLALASSINFPFSFVISEPNYLIRDAYLNVYGFTGSSTTGTNTLVSYVNVPGYVSQTCNFRNTGEARSDFCWDYVGDNITIANSYTVVLSSSVTRWFASKLIVTYSYMPFYKVEVEHNASIFFEGLLRNISIMINFTSSTQNTFSMHIYDFKNNQWNSTICQNLLANPNQFYVYWCNISNSEVNNFVSSDNKVRVRFFSNEDFNQGVLMEEYVQFFVTYEFINYAPILFDNIEIPNSPTTYLKNRAYIFKVKVTDLNGENDIDSVIFEFNGINQTVNNYVTINSTTREYSIEIYDLAANPYGYIFRWYAKDKRNSWSNVVEGMYVINKAIPEINLELSNSIVDYPNETNATCYLILGDEENNLKLYRNNTLVNSNKDRVSEIAILGAGVYEYSCYYEETQNFTSYLVENFILTINKGIPKVFLEINGMQNDYITYYPEEINITAWMENLYEEGEIKLYKNGNLIFSGKRFSEVSVLAAGEYYFDLIFEETQNYTYYEIRNRYLRINKGISSAQLIIYPESPITYGTETTAICIATNPEAEAKLWRNGTDVTSENGTAIILPAGIWYYECNVTETQNYTSASDSKIYIVNKAFVEVKLFLNGTEEDRVYTYGDFANITATINVSDKVIYIEANFSGYPEIIAYGKDVVTIITNNFGAGIYNITAYFPGDQNYTSSFKSLLMIVNKKPTNIYLWINGTRENKVYYDNATINFTVELLENNDIVQLLSNYSDGNYKIISSGVSPLITILNLDVGGIFNFTGYYPGNLNYTESSESWIVTIGKTNVDVEILPAQKIGINDVFNIKGVCSCMYVNCSNVNVELLVDNERISNESLSLQLVDGDNPYYLEGSFDYIEVFWNVSANIIGNYSIKVKCNSSEFYDKFSEEKTIEVIDNKAPKWFLNRSFPEIAYYSPNANYRFSIVWIDESEIEEVLIEHNFTSIVKNDSMIKNGNEFYFEIYDLPAGTYYWKSYAKDIYGNWNVSHDFIYVVNKAPVEIKIYFNGSEEQNVFDVYDIINVTAIINVSNKIIYLNSNLPNWDIVENNTIIDILVNLNKKGKFIFSSYFLGDQNYSSYYIEKEIEVVDRIPPKIVFIGQNRSWIGVGESLLIFGKWNDNYDLDYAWLETNENGSWENVSYVKLNLEDNLIWSNFTWRNPEVIAGSWISWRICANDTSNNINCSQIYSFFVNASKLWNITLNERIFSSPSIGDVNGDGEINVVIASFNGTLYAIRAVNGEILWMINLPGRIVGSPSLSQLENENYLRIFIGSYDYNLYAINGSDGSKIWNFSASGRIVSSAAIGDVNGDNVIDIVFGSEDGKVYCIDILNGNLIWSFQTNGRIVSSPSIKKIGDETYVFIGSYDYNLYAINGSDGSKIWNFSAKDKIESTPLIDDFDNDGKYEVVFGSYDRNVYVLDAQTGNLLWNYTTNNWITSSPITLRVGNDKKIIITSHDSKVYSFNPDGTINWTFTIPTGGRVPYLPSAFDANKDGIQDVIVGATDGRIYVINGLNGTLIWFYNIGNYIYTSPAIADLNRDGKLDVSFGGLDRNVYALDPPSWNMFGGNERSTRIYDIVPPKLIHYEKEIDGCNINIVSKWKDLSNLEFAEVFIESESLKERYKIKLLGPEDWVNITFKSCNNSIVNIKVLDEYGNVEKLEDYIEIKVYDNKPKIIEVKAIPNTSFYNKNQVYKILAKIEDDYEISNVLIENDFKGYLSNESMHLENDYFVYHISNLEANTYKFRIHACDLSNNCESSEWNEIIILKAPQNVTLKLDKETYKYGEFIKINCTAAKDEISKIKILINDSLIKEEISNEINISLKLQSGYWKVKCVAEESKNYLEGFDEKTIVVEKRIPKTKLKINYNESDVVLECPAKIRIDAYSLEEDEDVEYYLFLSSEEYNEFLGYGKNISLELVFENARNFKVIYNNSEGKNIFSHQIVRNVFIIDNKSPKNIFYKRSLNRDGLIITSKWMDNCSEIVRAIITENSNGNKEIVVKPVNGWVNYTISRTDLFSTYGCKWILGRICIKEVSFEIKVFDSFNNFAVKKDKVKLIFLSSRKI
ncbi:MAG: PQQ-binding-like beta-propeller repeat protein [Candidatus Aenigmatarchaeota archaeon]